MINPSREDGAKTLDSNSFIALYNSFGDELFHKLLAVLNSPEAVKDIVQDVFLKIWLRKEQIREGASMKRYIFRMGYNMAIDHHRRKKKESLMLQTYALLFRHCWLEEEDVLIKEEELSNLEKAITKLPPKRKMVFELCNLERKSYEEVSNILNVSLSTISDHIVKAKSFLKMEVNRRKIVA